MIEITNHQTKTEIPLKEIKNEFERVMEKLEIQDKEISLVFVDNQEIQGLHQQFLGINEDTDVLSFPLADNPEDPFLGEIVVSAEKAEEEAKSRGHSFKEELLLYSIHGLLHLLGYDDHKEEDRKEMEETQLSLLRFLGYQNIL
ncbi:MAG: rRNA maturation RNase YbeY [Planctomycetota bacterium]|nr:MAG: rRNA maturation RNase YbeY [Planctomycetota bacterium]